MRTADFRFNLPDRLIAQFPAPQRDASKLLVLDRSSSQLTHHPAFRDLLEYLRPGDLLVLNNSRVIPARLRGKKSGSSGEIEVLLFDEISRNEWWTMLRPGKRVRPGTEIIFAQGDDTRVTAVVLEKTPAGHCRLRFAGTDDIRNFLEVQGEVPLPPYISRRADAQDRARYQTVYARSSGSVAAPTAGLHFTEELLSDIKSFGAKFCEVTLHVGLGTFAPVKSERLEAHEMHLERFEIPAETADAIHAARASGGRIIAVGTTSVRVLETVAGQNDGKIVPGKGETRIFIYPPYRFKAVDALITNFHLPQSTLLMLVSAFASPGSTSGRELVLATYQEAVRAEYRFFSYGDAMLII
jgi:S-adenosylmethionine:tRNA ribosyltransferase-isomerase